MTRETASSDLVCRSCATPGEWPTTHRRSAGGSSEPRCPACDSLLTAPLEEPPHGDRLDSEPRSMWDADSLLPFDRTDAVTLGEGGTPTLRTPALAEFFDVEGLLLKDEGRNPTGSVRDREVSLAVTAAVEAGLDRVSLADTGTAARSLAAYAARADLAGTAVLPARSRFDQKAMVNVHDLDLTVVEGRLPTAEAALQEASAEGPPGVPLEGFKNPFRHVGARTLAPEVVASAGRPDAILVPTGEGTTIVGLFEGLRWLRAQGVIEELPRLYAVQPTGCAPIVEAHRSDRGLEPVDRPDTVCGDLEVPAPRGGEWVLDVLEATDGGAVAVPDDRILDTAIEVARRMGIEASPAGAAGLAGLNALRSEGRIDGSETVLAIVSGTGGADLLRSHAGVRGGLR